MLGIYLCSRPLSFWSQALEWWIVSNTVQDGHIWMGYGSMRLKHLASHIKTLLFSYTKWHPVLWCCKSLKPTTACTYKVSTSWCIRVLNTFNSQTLLLPASFACCITLPWKGWSCSRVSDTPRFLLWFGVTAACVCVQDSKYNAGVPAVVSEETVLSDRGFVSLF